MRITAIEGLVRELPREAERNTAGTRPARPARGTRADHGFELALEKGIPLGSGMGGSAASCVAALVAANALLERPGLDRRSLPLRAHR